MSALKLGIVTNVKNDRSLGILIDILGEDGTYYENVPVMNTPGSNEAPVPSEIVPGLPSNDPAFLSLVADSYDPKKAETAKYKTFVLYTEYTIQGYDRRLILPVRFLRNWAQETGSLPMFRKEPEPGGVTVQAAGTSQIPGGYLYLSSNGSVKLSTGFASFTLFADNVTGNTVIRSGSFHLDSSGINLDIEKNSLSLSHKMFQGTSYSPVPNAVVTVDRTGKIDIKSSPVVGVSSNITVTGDNVTVKSSTSTTSTSIELKGTGVITIEGNIEGNNTSVKIEITASGIEIDAGGKQVTVKNVTNFTIKGTGTQDFVALANQLTTALDNHIHSTPAGPSGPPIVPFSSVSASYTSKTLKTT
jgi:hypothetical protein